MEQTNPLPNPSVSSEAPVNPPINSSSLNKYVLIILSAVFLVVFSSLVTYLLVKSPTPPQAPAISPAPIVQPPTVIPSPISPTPTPNPIVNWKTYTNPILGYSIQYPETLKVAIPQLEGNPAVKLAVFTDMTTVSNGNPDDDSTLYKKIGGIGGIGGVVIYRGFWLRVDTTGLDSPDDVIENVTSSNKDSDRLNIDGGTAYKSTASDEGGGYKGTTIWVTAIKGKKVVHIIAMFPSNVESYPILFDQILSTFKFLK